MGVVHKKAAITCPAGGVQSSPALGHREVLASEVSCAMPLLLRSLTPCFLKTNSLHTLTRRKVLYAGGYGIRPNLIYWYPSKHPTPVRLPFSDHSPWNGNLHQGSINLRQGRRVNSAARSCELQAEEQLLELDCASQDGQGSDAESRESAKGAASTGAEKLRRKKKVAMWLGYLGTPYKGLQIQRGDPGSSATVEAELERAILASDGMLPSNYGDLGKLGWQRSSRTDKGVHSIATVISYHMEVPRDAWERDPDGLELAAAINAHLTPAIRVFSVVPASRSFSARKSCKGRTYQYLLPAAVLGLDGREDEGRARTVLEEFQSILQEFEGKHPFHNYTVRRLYRPSAPSAKRGSRDGAELPCSPSADSASGKATGGAIGGEQLELQLQAEGSEGAAVACGPQEIHGGKEARFWHGGNDSEEDGAVLGEGHGRHSDGGEGLGESDGEGSSGPSTAEGPQSGGNSEDGMDATPFALTAGDALKDVRRAWWVSEPPDKDRIGSSHFRVVKACSCGAVEANGGAQFVRITIAGESFMLHQIRKMIGSAVAVLRRELPRDLFRASLSRHARVVLPLAPAEGLLLYSNEFFPFRGSGKASSAAHISEHGPLKDGAPPSPLGSGSSSGEGPRVLHMSPPVEATAHQFLEEVVLPAVAPVLHVEREPWATWLQNLHAQELVPQQEAEEVVRAWEARQADIQARFSVGAPGLENGVVEQSQGFAGSGAA